MKVQRTIWSLCLILSGAAGLSGCSLTINVPGPPETPVAKATQPGQSTHLPRANRPSGRGRLLQVTNAPPRRAQPSEPAMPGYDPGRLAMSGQLKGWAPIDIEGTGIQVWMKTKWSDGKLLMRIAMLGPRDSLSMLTSGSREFQVKLRDRAGGDVDQFILPPSEFKWAPPTANHGVPTMEFESSASMPLELYERGANWNFYWSY
jgi:hypothetical protein